MIRKIKKSKISIARRLNVLGDDGVEDAGGKEDEKGDVDDDGDGHAVVLVGME